MITPEPCRGCGRILYLHPVANLTARIEPVPLTDAEIVGELLAGHPLWANDSGKVRPARIGERGVAREHRCTGKAQEAVRSVQQPPRPPSVRQDPPAVRTAPSRGLLGGTVGDADLRVSRKPACEACRPGVGVVDVLLGDLHVWARHVAECP